MSDHYQPHLVVDKGLKRKVAQPAVLAVADAVVDPRVAAVGQVELGDVVALLVGEERR